MSFIDQARELLANFKGGNYINGPGVLSRLPDIFAFYGKKVLLVRNTFAGSEDFLQVARSCLHAVDAVVVETDGAQPNAPREDLQRILEETQRTEPDVLLCFGGGSTIDAVKAAQVLYGLGGEIDEYFGTGLVSQAMKTSGKKLLPHIAIQTVASSAAHLTKYSIITDVQKGQKKLIIDEAIVPEKSLFDFQVTYGTPISLTIDGALDGISHCLEFLYSSVGKENYDLVEKVAGTTFIDSG